MRKRRSENLEYYAFIRGFCAKVSLSSEKERLIHILLGETHHLVTGFSKADFQGFHTLAEAEKHMERKGVEVYYYSIKHCAGMTTPKWDTLAYYEVANGRNSRILLVRMHQAIKKLTNKKNGRGGAELEVHQVSGGCHTEEITGVIIHV